MARNRSNFDVNKFKQRVKNIECTSLYAQTEVNLAYNELCDKKLPPGSLVPPNH